MPELSTETMVLIAVSGAVFAERILTTLKAKGVDLPLMSERQRKADDKLDKLTQCQIDIIKILKEIEKKNSELHKWHNKEDNDGVKVWYNRRSTEQALRNLTTTLRELAASLLVTKADEAATKAGIDDLKEKIDSMISVMERQPKNNTKGQQ